MGIGLEKGNGRRKVKVGKVTGNSRRKGTKRVGENEKGMKKRGRKEGKEKMNSGNSRREAKGEDEGPVGSRRVLNATSR